MRPWRTFTVTSHEFRPSDMTAETTTRSGLFINRGGARKVSSNLVVCVVKIEGKNDRNLHNKKSTTAEAYE